MESKRIKRMRTKFKVSNVCMCQNGNVYVKNILASNGRKPLSTVYDVILLGTAIGITQVV